MEEGGNILEAIFEEEYDDALEEVDDVEMVDVEEGEITEQRPHIDSDHNAGGDGDGVRSEIAGNQASQSKNQLPNGNKKNKKKRNRNRKRKGGGGGGPGTNVTNIDRFVIDTCRRLREKKSYMVYTAVGCLGLSRLSDLVNEVVAIESCGGQMTADGGRSRTGGGILWNIMKTKEPTAFKEIMKKCKEFEKQFRPQNIRQAPQKHKELPSQGIVLSSDAPSFSVPGDGQLEHQNQHEQSSAEKKLKSVHERIRVPVLYDDLVGDDTKNDSVISEIHGN